MSIFVSRLSPDVDVEALRAHVEQLAGVEGTTECQQQEQRHHSYKSFKVVIRGMLKERIPDLYKPENWHKDVLVKRWFNSLGL